MEWLRLVRVEWIGAERLGRAPFLVVANHPSLIDTPLLTCQMQQADFLVSAAWSENPFLRHAARSSGYLRADRGAKVVRDAVERLRAGRTVVVFPEGTRSPAGGLGRFHRGAAHIALETGCDIVPMVIHVEPRVLMKGQFWADVPERRPVFRVEVGDPIRVADTLDGSESRPLAARRLTGLLQDYFEKRWTRGTG